MSHISFVHVIDTEGPLYESPAATVQRLQEITGAKLPDLAPSFLIQQLKAGLIKLPQSSSHVENILSDHRLHLNPDWQTIDVMLEKIGNPKFRNKFLDCEERPWALSWFCLDHIGYSENPRKRDIGYHNIFDHYASYRNSLNYGDDIFFHFHPMSRYNEAHRCATSYSQSPHLYETLCRRLIDRSWFPSAFRAGFQAERPDSHLFLEQWIPFDFTNMAIENWESLETHSDFRLGRSGNWKGAPCSWEPYHPDLHDHRKIGNCHRWIARSLNTMNRIAGISIDEIRKAFLDAQKTGNPQIVGMCGHDWRDLESEIQFLSKMIFDVASQFPETKIYFDNARTAFQRYLSFFSAVPPSPDLKVECFHDTDDFPRIKIELNRGKIFGPQPFLAIKSPSRNYYHDNLDYYVDSNVWHYAFTPDSIDVDDVAELAVGLVDNWGRTVVKNFKREPFSEGKLRLIPVITTN